MSSGSLRGLLAAVSADPFFAAMNEATGSITHRVTGPPAIRPFVAGTLAAGYPDAGVPVLLVTATGREAEAAVASIGDLIGDDRVALFPSWETLPHERLSPRADTVGRRLATLRRLAHPEEHPGGYPAVVVATIRSMIQPMAPHLGEMAPVTLRVGQEVDLTELVDRLVSLAYGRVDMVEKRGEIAVRGGILDIFPPTADHPIRVEFWGDEISDLRTFGVTDQRSLGAVEQVVAPPCREILLTAEVRERAAQLSAQQTGDPTLAQMLDNLANGITVEGMESLIPVLVGDDLELLPNLVRPGTHVVLADPERIRTRAADLVRTGEEFLAASWMAAATGGRADRPRVVGLPVAGRGPRRRPGCRATDLAGGLLRIRGGAAGVGQPGRAGRTRLSGRAGVRDPRRPGAAGRGRIDRRRGGRGRHRRAGGGAAGRGRHGRGGGRAVDRPAAQ